MLDSNMKIGVVGLGYVGLPLAIEFSNYFKTVGYDKNIKRIEELKKGFDRTRELEKNILLKSSLEYAGDSKFILDCDVYIVTVPTPIDKFNKPNLEPLRIASQEIGGYLKKNNLVIYESTVFPGATEQFCVPILEKSSGLKYNKGFFCGYSPERINPGDKNHTLKKIIKVTSGSNEKTSLFVDELYKKIIPAGTYKASSIAVAESAKVIENTQRDVNIALMNELALIFQKLDLDTTEILEAAGTKWNFLPFRPGLVGGHCIGVDPYYLTYKALELGYAPEIILAGRKLNDNMDKYILDNLILNLKKINIEIKNARIAVFGVTFKENCPDLRNSKVFKIINNLKKYKCEVLITDECVNQDEAKEVYGVDLISVKEIKKVEAVILAVGHDFYKSISISLWEKILVKNGILMDIKSLFGKSDFVKSNLKHWRL